MRLNLQDGFKFVHILFGIMVKFQFMEQFLLNRPPPPVVFRIVHLLLYNSRGISVHAFEFSLAENLSARHMG